MIGNVIFYLDYSLIPPFSDWILGNEQCKNSGNYDDERCSNWKQAGYCTDEKQQQFMWDHCRKTCSLCVPGMKSNLILTNILEIGNQ